MTKKHKLLLFAIVFFAIFFRFYLITEMPGGLFPDEAANGLDINSMQSGQLQPFYERGNGREALFFYLLWGSVELFGKGAWQHHIVSGLIGVLSVVICYFATRKLFSLNYKNDQQTKEDVLVSDKRASIIALLSAFFMAVSSWHIVLSRTAFRANLIPLFATLVVFFFLKTFEAYKLNLSWKKILMYSGLTGAAFALGFYTYIAYRILVLIFGVALFWPLCVSTAQTGFINTLKKYKISIAGFLLSFVVFFYPLFNYFYTHPGSFVGRSGQVSVFNVDLNQGNLPAAIGTVAYLSIRAYFIDGDLNWRHNISGWPFLSELISPFFGIGLVIVTLLAAVYMIRPKSQAGFWKYFLLAGWFWGMLLPVITTAEGIPHGLRSIGTIPPVFIISGWAVYWFAHYMHLVHKKFWHRCEKCHDQHYESISFVFRKTLSTFAIKFTAICFFAALILQSYIGYFVYAYNSPENFYAFRSDLTTVSDYLKIRCLKDSTYLVLDKFSVQTIDYVTSDPNGDFTKPCSVPYKQVDPEDSWKLTDLKFGDEIIFAQSSIFDIKKFKDFHPNIRLVYEARNKFGQAITAVYRVE
ncbi:MAG: hypothetical protein JNN11_02405 [Candidatus Doudnabacteria bacterium]|nr:hypothetical protein [Candidatus Doudnabacteria bacterium]